MTIEEVVEVLTEFNKWRRAEPPYEWHEEPSLNIELPYDVRKIGEAIDVAVKVLEEVRSDYWY